MVEEGNKILTLSYKGQERSHRKKNCTMKNIRTIFNFGDQTKFYLLDETNLAKFPDANGYFDTVSPGHVYIINNNNVILPKITLRGNWIISNLMKDLEELIPIEIQVYVINKLNEELDKIITPAKPYIRKINDNNQYSFNFITSCNTPGACYLMHDTNTLGYHGGKILLCNV